MQNIINSIGPVRLWVIGFHKVLRNRRKACKYICAGLIRGLSSCGVVYAGVAPINEVGVTSFMKSRVQMQLYTTISLN